ncbi:MAG TPA: hypothetical protein DCW72_07020, partial [Elusimicrobia bacterium]|nr:hypothetical protein [Elusimicrobiota bacterium]
PVELGFFCQLRQPAVNLGHVMERQQKNPFVRVIKAFVEERYRIFGIGKAFVQTDQVANRGFPFHKRLLK